MSAAKQKQRIIISMLVLIVILCVGIGGWLLLKKDNETLPPPQDMTVLQVVSQVKEQYDVIVVGTDPEGVAAALSAARNDLNVLLVDGKERTILGGLMTIGWLNSLDHNYAQKQPGPDGKHNLLNKGIFQEWYDRVEGTSFDTTTAANAFHQLVNQEERIDVLMEAQAMKPLLANDARTVTGLAITTKEGKLIEVRSSAVIDATQDADIAAAAGVGFTFGREDLGDPDALMAVTLVFKLGNITPEIWDTFNQQPGTGADARSAWGFGSMWEYPTSDKERVRMRGLNIGRQNDDTILINAMQIFGVNPLDPASVDNAFQIGHKELPLIVDYMKENYEPFKDTYVVDAAPELYVRESRHMLGQYRLTMDDLMDNRDFWDRIAFGSYNVDIQSTHFDYRGDIVMKPIQYAIPFRSIVPLEHDGILVVGRSASFDSLPHGSARVIPVGMATAQAAGAAAKLSIEHNISFREMSNNQTLIKELQFRLNEQGMELEPFEIELPDYMSHPAYEGLKVAVSLLMTTGGEKNDFSLDKPSNPSRLVYQINKAKQVNQMLFPGNPDAALADIADPDNAALTLQHFYRIVASARNLDPSKAEATISAAITPATTAAISNPLELTNGDVYRMIAELEPIYAQSKE